MRVNSSVGDGYQYPGSARDLMSFIHPEEVQMPLIFPDSQCILWRGWLRCLG